MHAVLRTAMLLAIAVPGAAMAQAGPAGQESGAAPHLFRVIGPRDDVTVGLTAAELEAFGSASAQESGVERLARKLAANGQVTMWRYVVGRAPDGTTRFVADGQIAILRSNALRIEPYRAALPVAPAPGAR